MMRAQRTALEQLAGDMEASDRCPERFTDRLDAILALPEPDHTALFEKLTRLASFYDRWYQGDVRMDGGSVAYELVTGVREAITALRGEDQP